MIAVQLIVFGALLDWADHRGGDGADDTTSYRPFVIYRYAAGIAVLLVIALGLRPATF